MDALNEIWQNFVYPQRMSRDLYRNLLRLRVDSKPEQSKIK